MKIVEISTHLNAPPERVWEEVNRPQLLVFVAYPILQFRPVKPASLPDYWAGGDYVFDLRWQSIVPLGKQVISISRPPTEGLLKCLRDNGQNALTKRWDHLISVEPEGDGTRYTDRIEVDAGILTPLMAAFARSFYAHRQRRWHKLVEADFDYSIG